MPESVCIQLLNRYEAERKDKLEQRSELSARLEVMSEDVQAVDGWIEMIRNYADLAELDRPTLLRLIRKIEVSEKYEKDGETHRDIKIYYNFVGYVEI